SGATFVTIPSSLEQESIQEDKQTVISSGNHPSIPTDQSFEKAVDLLKHAEKPLILAGLGTSRDKASKEVTAFAEKHQIPVATSFMAKGVLSDASELSFGTVGFFIEDYINRYIEDVDVILTIGYEF